MSGYSFTPKYDEAVKDIISYAVKYARRKYGLSEAEARWFADTMFSAGDHFHGDEVGDNEEVFESLTVKGYMARR